MKYTVVRQHRSEYPYPICLTQGDALTIGARYDGPEGWSEWYFCEVPGQAGAWVPRQLIERVPGTCGLAKEDYSSRELDVDVGDVLSATRHIDGWVWCHRASPDDAGWVPMSHLTLAPAR
ncbi:MAG: ligand-binding protein SH3 [Burkholderiaceae bacterium]|nr:ligand-binding protein SH3 [Burkholderiaceae bacterium]